MLFFFSFLIRSLLVDVITTHISGDILQNPASPKNKSIRSSIYIYTYIFLLFRTTGVTLLTFRITSMAKDLPSIIDICVCLQRQAAELPHDKKGEAI